MFVILRTSPSRAYVAPPGSPSSYVRDVRRARTFSTAEAADRERCPENEVVIPYPYQGREVEHG